MALKHIKKLAKKDENAKFLLGKMYYDGVGTKKDLRKAFSIFSKYSKTNANCGVYQGYMLAKGIGCSKNDKLALKVYSNSASLGNPCANYTLGMCYSKGALGAKIDQQKADTYFDVAEQGNFYYKNYEKSVVMQEQAKKVLLDVFATADQVTNARTQMAEAMILLNRAAQLGCIEAQIGLANEYLRGEFLEADYAKAYNYVMQAKQAGNINANYLLAYMYDNGKGVVADDWKAYDMYRKCLKSGITKAKFPVLISQLKGIGCQQDIKSAMKELHKMSKEKNSQASFILSQCYKSGEFVKKANKKKSKSYFDKALKAEYAPAIYQQAILNDSLFDGKDDDTAISLYNKAVEKGIIDAMVNLALHYSKGVGVDMNKEKAESLLMRAACSGSGYAYYVLYQQYVSGDLACGLSDVQTLSLLEKSANLRYEKACEKLHAIYTNGEDGWEKDREKAIYWKERLAMFGRKEYYQQLSDIFNFGNEFMKKNGEKAAYWTAKIVSECEDKKQVKKANKLLKTYSKNEDNWGFPIIKSKKKDKKQPKNTASEEKEVVNE